MVKKEKLRAKVTQRKGKLFAWCPSCNRPNRLNPYAAAQIGSGHTLSGMCKHCPYVFTLRNR